MLHECPAFSFEIDEYRNGAKQMIFVHLSFHKWSASALKKFTAVFNAFRQSVDCPLYAYGKEDTPKFGRFVARFGFTPVSTLTCFDGEGRTLFISLKEPIG